MRQLEERLSEKPHGGGPVESTDSFESQDSETSNQKYQYGIFRHIYESLNTGEMSPETSPHGNESPPVDPDAGSPSEKPLTPCIHELKDADKTPPADDLPLEIRHKLLRDEYKSLNRRHEKMQYEYTLLKSEYESLVARLATPPRISEESSVQETQAFNRGYETAMGEQDKLKRAHADLIRRFEALSLELESLKSGRDSLFENVAVAESAVDSQHLSFPSTAATYDHLREITGNYEALKTEHAAQADQIRGLKTEIESLANLCKQLKDISQSEKDEHRSLAQKYEALKNEHQLLLSGYHSLVQKHEEPRDPEKADQHEAMVQEHELETRAHKLAKLEFDALQREHQILKHDYEVLKSENEALNEILSNFLS